MSFRVTLLSSIVVVSAYHLLTDSAACRSNGEAAQAHANVERYLQDKMRELRIPGMQVAVVDRGQIVFSRAYGLANVEHQVATKPQTLFQINSATKSFTGVALMQLAESGSVVLDAPASKYLNDLPEGWESVTVRHLLGHTSGLPNIVDQNGLIGGGSTDSAWRAVRELPCEFVAGERFAYNQTNYALLGRIIEQASGTTFARFVAERQFKVADMPTSRFGDSFDVIPGGAQPYSFMRRVRGTEPVTGTVLTRWVDDTPEFLQTAGGIQTTAEELAHWIIALKQGRLLTSPTSLRQLWTPTQLNDGSANIWALGWPTKQAGTHRVVAGIGGGRSAFFVYPEDDLAVVVLTNLVGAGPESFIDDVARFYLAAAARTPSPGTR